MVTVWYVTAQQRGANHRYIKQLEYSIPLCWMKKSKPQRLPTLIPFTEYYWSNNLVKVKSTSVGVQVRAELRVLDREAGVAGLEETILPLKCIMSAAWRWHFSIILTWGNLCKNYKGTLSCSLKMYVNLQLPQIKESFKNALPIKCYLY
jgi:hypothetical protein